MSAPRRYARASSDDLFELRIGLVFRRFWERRESERAHVERLGRVWHRHGPALMEDYRPGRRPWGWWRFEAQVDPPSAGEEVERLVELDALREDELQHLVDAGDRFQLRYPPPYLDVPQTVHDGNVAREALGMAEVQVEVRDVGGEG